ncbi:unnamed protein product [Phytomonas sp. Hart1]|nr:unnamed protein product [Phytomonas sp. Hart1]|eukprot:CCW68858.1 unnamed protein product [Phytomonas sp. isolate Hart1]
MTHLGQQFSPVCMADASAISPRTQTPDMASTDSHHKNHLCNIRRRKNSFGGVYEVLGTEEDNVVSSDINKGCLTVPQSSLREKSRDNSVVFKSGKTSNATQSSDSEDDEGWVRTSARAGSPVDSKPSQMTSTTKFQSFPDVELEATTPHYPIINFSECIAIPTDVATTTFPESKYPHPPTEMHGLPPTAPGTCADELDLMINEKQSATTICAKRHLMQSTAFSRSTLVPRMPPLVHTDSNASTEIGSKSLNYSCIPNHILSCGCVHNNNNNNSIFMDLVPSSFSNTPGTWSPNPTSTNKVESSFLCSIVKHKGRSALIAELMHRRECLKKKLTQLQLAATEKNIFAIVRASKASQLQYLLQERLLNVNKRDYNGCTPLHVAVSEGNMAIVKVLLSFGADILALDSFGRTPLDCAAAHRQSGVARYLMAVIRAPSQQEVEAAADIQSAEKNDDQVFADPPEVSSSLSLPSPLGCSMASSLAQAQDRKISIDASFLSIPDFAPSQPFDKVNEEIMNDTSSSALLKAAQRSVTPQEVEATKKEIENTDAIKVVNLLEGLPPVGIDASLRATLNCVSSSDVPFSQPVPVLISYTDDNTRNENGADVGKTILTDSQLMEAQRYDALVGCTEQVQELPNATIGDAKSNCTIGIDSQNWRCEFKATMTPFVTTKAVVLEKPLESFVEPDIKANQSLKKLILNNEAEKIFSHEKPMDMGITLREHSKFTTIPDNVSLIVCLCGLPARGKSYITIRLMRYMNWKGIPCRVFNAGSYRRKLLGTEGTSKADFYDPNNFQGRKQREIMATLACEDLINFIMLYRVAIGILDATNTTKSRRSRLKNFFSMECGRRGLQYRLLFIESVCTDEGIITENILRSKCKNGDFKGINDTNVVIAEFRKRIQQYEKVYETLHPSEGLSFIKIINAKHHIILYKVSSGLGSRVGFFLMNLHPISYPIYIVLPGETEGDHEGVYGGSERLTPRGESFSWALKNFIQDRYVPHMLILHGTNQSVLSTLRPLLQGDDEATLKSNLNYLYQPLVHHHAFDGERAHHRHHRDEDSATALARNTGIVFCRHAANPEHSSRSMILPNISNASRVVSPSSQMDRTPLPMRSMGEVDVVKTMKGGYVNMVPFLDTHCQQSQEHQDGRKGVLSHTECLENNDEDDETIEEVLCGVPGLDNINYGLFSGRDATWALQHYPRLLPLIHVSGLADPHPDPGVVEAEATAQEGAKVEAFTATPTITRSNQGHGACVTPPIHFSSFEDALRCLCRFPTDVDPSLAYNMHFPNGESFRQVSVRLEPALMAVMRTQSSVFVVASPITAQGVLAFFADVMPEQLMTLRLPQHCVVEIGFNESIIVHPLLPDSEVNCKPNVVSPILTQEEINKTLKLAYSTHYLY